MWLRGYASKVFQPFMSPGDFKGSLEELKNKLLVNFDPQRFFVGDLEASIFTGLMLILKSLLSLFTLHFLLTHAQRVFQHVQGVV